jgi:hypothetical protein
MEKSTGFAEIDCFVSTMALLMYNRKMMLTAVAEDCFLLVALLRRSDAMAQDWGLLHDDLVGFFSC